MQVIKTNEPIRLSGRYLVTDPCYVYGDGDWSRFCDLLFENEGYAASKVPYPDLNQVDSIEDPKERIKAMFDLDRQYEAARREAERKHNEERRNMITLFEIDGKRIPVMSTAYGDGSYPVFDPETGLEVGMFGVDAGLFAFIPWNHESHGMRSDLGTIIEVDGVLTCDNGNAYINDKLVVDTNGESDVEEDWNDDEEV